MTSQVPGGRNLEPEFALDSYYEYRERWAVVVGISKYVHTPWKLDYARRDAEKLAEMLQQSAYGAFDKKRMCILLDEEATTAKIIKALRSFLRRPAANDLVLLYFSCHGTPDPDGEDEVYLVTHDTEAADIPATALPMREIRHALESTLKAERVVILADTCHSAAIVGGGRKTVTPTAQVMKQYMQGIGKAKPGRAWLLSAEANEVSLEDARWGGGHGLFTHQVIEGLKGAADKGRKGLVKVGDLSDFVYDRVTAESGDKQHPSKGTGVYDRNLVLAVTAHLHRQEHYALGILLERMGWLLDDPRRFKSASTQFERAFRLAAEAGEGMPEAAVRCGLARLALADGGPARGWFETALSWFEMPENAAIAADPTALADARFHLPLALLEFKRPLVEVLAALDTFLAEHPDDPRSACAREIHERIGRAEKTRRRALLIGVGQFEDSSLPTLRGPENDVRELRKVLVERLGFADEDVLTLQDQAATRTSILQALETLRQQAGPDDAVLVYFSGHGIPDRSEPYWVSYETSQNQSPSTLGASELHAALKAIGAANTIAIVDSHSNDNFLAALRDDPAYTLLLAASPREHALEITVDQVPYGAFTWGLLRALRQVDPIELTPKRIKEIALREFRHQQTPLIVGDDDHVLFPRSLDFPALFRFSCRQRHEGLPLERVMRVDRQTNDLKHPFPRLRQSIGRAYLELGRSGEATRLFDRARSESPPGSEDDELTLGQCCAHLTAKRVEEARDCLRQLTTRPNTNIHTSNSGPWSDLARLVEGHRVGHRALLVGINGYLCPSVPTPGGCVADVDALAIVLKERWGFDVRVLTDAAATREAILDGFKELAEWSRDVPCVFAFSGLGSEDLEGRPTLLAADSRLRPDIYDDIDLYELAAIARNTGGQLTTIFDAGWTNARDLTENEEGQSAGRTAPRSSIPRMTPRDLGVKEERRSLEKLDLQVGCLAIYGPSLGVSSYTTETGVYYSTEDFRADPDPQSTERKKFGDLSHALITALWTLKTETDTWQEWLREADRIAGTPCFAFSGSTTGEYVFGPPPFRIIVDLLARVERQSIAELVPRLKQLIKDQPQPEALLNLGLAHDALGEPQDAVEALGDAMDHEDAPPDLQAEAQYHLGRILYTADLDLDRSISMLNEAIVRDPNLAGSYYYCGLALQDSARRNLRELSVARLREYLLRGAPLGHRDKVRRLIERSRNSPTEPGSAAVQRREGNKT